MPDREPVMPPATPPSPQPEYLPLMLFTTWWSAMLDAWCPACPHHTMAAGTRDLPVPDPIEETGEHALFA